jgi:hypothetical protein
MHFYILSSGCLKLCACAAAYYPVFSALATGGVTTVRFPVKEAKHVFCSGQRRRDLFGGAFMRDSDWIN